MVNIERQVADSTAAARRGPASAGTSARFSGWLNAEGPLALQRPLRHEASGGVVRIEAPGLQIELDPSRVDCGIDESAVTLCTGAPRSAGANATLSALEIGREIGRRGLSDWAWLGGRFAVIHVDLAARTVILVTDRFNVHPICYLQQGPRIAFSDRADTVPMPGQPELEPQAIYNYLYFHVIPATRTIFRDVRRLEPSQVVRCGPGGRDEFTWWQPQFASAIPSNLDALKSRFLEVVHRAVEREATTVRIGSFLSGGTDSSTVAGMLCRVIGRPVPTFSIGFDAAGYDEMSYARIASRHFGTEQHEYYLTPEDVVDGIPRVAVQYDQPFGNSSALAAYLCALRAKEAGVEKLLAGDGGDELFGGNSRYAKQNVFDFYRTVPEALRNRLIEPILVDRRWARNVPVIKKAASYVEQARIPMPARMETYNVLDRFGARKVFTARFLESIEEGEPQALQRAVYSRARTGSLIDRMLAYDWRFTLADNDLPKVTGTTQLAGPTVGFPLLDDELVDFSLLLAPSLKVRGLTLRFFFKEALKGFLPDAIIRKRKHGFGLPFGIWLTRHEPLQAMARRALEQVAARGIIRAELARELLSTRLQEHAAYFGEMIWILMMLEHWLEAKAPDYAV